MGNIFDFGDIKSHERTIRKTWAEFRNCLANGMFSYNEIEKAKEQTFLRVYDDLFHKHHGIDYNTILFKELKNQLIGRGTILKDDEIPNYERFIPKEKFIKEDNRFSPPRVEWLYLAIGNDEDIHECGQAECRAQKGDRFGFCHFQFEQKYDECKLVDLTIADDVSYEKLNNDLEKYGQMQVKKGKQIARVIGYVPQININKNKFKKLFTQWTVYTYSKLLSEQIFLPLDVSDNKSIMYAPFQTMAQYYISLGYSGVVYGSTVCPAGKNIVLFDKKMAFPIGEIEDYFIL